MLIDYRRFSIEPTSRSKTDERISLEAKRVDVTGSALHNASTGGQAETTPAPVAKELNIDKLAYCIAIAETNDCTVGMGVTKNNCFGIMTWTNGKRTGRKYNTKEESYQDFKRIWLKSYKTFPTYTMANKWTGGDNTQTWLNNVTNCYYN